DRIVWVEGATEEDCLPLILRKKQRELGAGTAIVGLADSSELKMGGDRAERIHQLMSKLSSGRSILPPVVGVILDPETLTLEQQAQKLSKHNWLGYLGRRMYEN